VWYSRSCVACRLKLSSTLVNGTCSTATAAHTSSNESHPARPFSPQLYARARQLNV
jgi:hypothetical protein